MDVAPAHAGEVSSAGPTTRRPGLSAPSGCADRCGGVTGAAAWTMAATLAGSACAQASARRKARVLLAEAGAGFSDDVLEALE
jgi:hypothetical protein